MRFSTYFDGIKLPRNPLLDIGLVSNGFGLLFTTGRTFTTIPSSNQLNYFASDGSTLLLTMPVTSTFTGTLYNQPIQF